MRLVVSALCFCAVALAQSAPVPSFQLPEKLISPQTSIWEQRLKGMKLIDPSHVTIQQTVSVTKPKTCAVPLLNALPAKSTVDYKIRTVTPSENVEHSNAVMPQIALPACPPAGLAPEPETEKH